MISVVMPVYKPNLEHLKLAIESIINQSYKNFEFIIVLDGDLSAQRLIESYNDNRINIIINKENHGISRSLNIAIEQSIGDYIFRMDADDISLQNRLIIQLGFLKRGASIVSSGCILINDNGDIIGKSKSIPLFHSFIRRIQLYQFGLNPVIHPTIAAKREVFNTFKYNPDFKYAQDFELWMRIRSIHKIHFIPHRLIHYRSRIDLPEIVNQKKKYSKKIRSKS